MVPASALSFLRGSAASTLGIGALYALFELVPVRPLVLPGYLIVVGFDVLENVFGSAGSSYALLFALYIIGLGLVGGLLAHAIKVVSGRSDVPEWRLGLAAGFAVVGVIAFLFAVLVYTGTMQSEPVMIATATGVVLLVLALLVGTGPQLFSKTRSA